MNFEYLDHGNPNITEQILRSLPDWFGIEEAILNYIDASKNLPMLVAYEAKAPVGFISIKQHSSYAAELYVMGVDPGLIGDPVDQ